MHIWCIYENYQAAYMRHICKINMKHICYLIYDAYMIHFSWVVINIHVRFQMHRLVRNEDSTRPTCGLSRPGRIDALAEWSRLIFNKSDGYPCIADRVDISVILWILKYPVIDIDGIEDIFISIFTWISMKICRHYRECQRINLRPGEIHECGWEFRRWGNSSPSG